MASDELLHYEEVRVGETFDCGTITVDEDEMLEFAARYDPQPIHTDPERARESIFGGLIASGWFTASLSARLLVQGFMNRTASMGGRGMDDLRWHTPVRAGDELSVSVEVVEKREFDPVPGVGEVHSEVVTTNDDEPVLSMLGLGLVKERAADW